MDSIADRLRWARKRSGYKTGSEAAKAHGWTVSTYLGHENGDRNPSRKTAKTYARAFKTRWEWLLEGEGSPTGKPNSAPVLGYVGAGAVVFPVDDFSQGEALDFVDFPAGPAVALIVRGDSMYPRYFDGERLFYVSREMPPSELIGQECVVQLKDGAALVKILRRGSKANRFNLESWNAPTLENQEVAWAAPVKWRG